MYLSILSEISTKNKYFKIYKDIVIRGLKRADTRKKAISLFGYTEGHHIIPKSFNLVDATDKNNMVYLTSKEHILVHHLLCKFTTGDFQISAFQAFHCMCNQENGGKNTRKPSLRQIARSRELCSIARRTKRGVRGVPIWFKESRDMDVL